MRGENNLHSIICKKCYLEKELIIEDFSHGQEESLLSVNNNNIASGNSTKAWTVPFRFPAVINEQFHRKCNILQYVGEKCYKNTLHVFFDSQKYSCSNPVHPFKCDGYDQLSLGLCQAALSQGFSIRKNGLPLRNINGTKKVQTQMFVCSRCQRYRGNTSEKQETRYKKISYRNDRKRNSRGEKGRNLPRRRGTSLAFDSS